MMWNIPIIGSIFDRIQIGVSFNQYFSSKTFPLWFSPHRKICLDFACVHRFPSSSFHITYPKNRLNTSENRAFAKNYKWIGIVSILFDETFTERFCHFCFSRVVFMLFDDSVFCIQCTLQSIQCTPSTQWNAYDFIEICSTALFRCHLRDHQVKWQPIQSSIVQVMRLVCQTQFVRSLAWQPSTFWNSLYTKRLVNPFFNHIPKSFCRKSGLKIEKILLEKFKYLSIIMSHAFACDILSMLLLCCHWLDTNLTHTTVNLALLYTHTYTPTSTQSHRPTITRTHHTTSHG